MFKKKEKSLIQSIRDIISYQDGPTLLNLRYKYNYIPVSVAISGINDCAEKYNKAVCKQHRITVLITGIEDKENATITIIGKAIDLQSFMNELLLTPIVNHFKIQRM